MNHPLYLSSFTVIHNEQQHCWHTGKSHLPLMDLFQQAPLSLMLGKKASRMGRFDRYTLTGCAAVGLTLADALWPLPTTATIGFILASQYGSMITDLEYYNTCADNGKLASPNLFSYTLPNIIIGECALQYGLHGPTFCFDGEGPVGQTALNEAAWCLMQTHTHAMLVGWLEILPEPAKPGNEGAQMVLLEKEKRANIDYLDLILDDQKGLCFTNGQVIQDFAEILAQLHMESFKIEETTR